MSKSESPADKFIARLMELRSDDQLAKNQRYFKNAGADRFIGVRMGSIFELAKENIDMPTSEIERMMESPVHEIRAGAMSIMGQCAKRKKVDAGRLKELYDLYIRRHDRINDWDLVDLAAYFVIGRYLEDKPRDILYKLARSKNMWERRTAIVSTAHFIRRGDTDDTFKIAEMLVRDNEDLVNKGTGWMVRYAGDKDRAKLLRFLDEFAAEMPRVLLRYSIEKLDADTRSYYLKLKTAA
jgi:3-methyladenine DNA glycosylase AlkD